MAASDRRSPLHAGLSVATGLLVLLAVPAAASTSGLGGALVAATAFRLAAAADPTAALREHATSAALRDWEREIAPYFEGQELQLADFFSSALLIPGCAGGGQVVIAFDNPWHDALFLTSWRQVGDRARLARFALVGGESWRGESIVEPVAVPRWEREAGTVPEGLFEQVRGVLVPFRERYPFDEECWSLEKGLPHSERARLEQVALVKSRMLRRMQVLLDFLSAGQGSETERLRRAAGRVANAIRSGEAADVAALFDGPFLPGTLEALLALPDHVRSGLSPNAVYRKEDRGIVALVSSTSPRHCVVVYFRFRERVRPWTLELVDLNRVDEALAAPGPRVPGGER